MRGLHIVTTCIVSACTAGLVSATETTDSVAVGGAGSASSEGFDDPGLLSDGITPASATYTFTLDDVAGTLTLEVLNTSPVFPGVCNPVLSDIFFNVPVEVTGMTLTSQTSSSGPNTSFVLTFDAELFSAPNPNGAAGFGHFSVGLNDTGGIAGGIANPLADTLPGPPGSMAVSPVTFVFDLTGDLGAITASDFVSLFSVIPPGNNPSIAVGHFPGGGPSCGASAFINQGDGGECFLVLGRGPGAGIYASPTLDGHVFQTQVATPGRAFGMYLNGLVAIPFSAFWGDAAIPARPRAEFGSPSAVVISRFCAQALLWDPQVIPQNPEQSSNGLDITVWSDHTFTAVPFGIQDGMTLSAEVYTTADGRSFLRFPFTIEGL